jgi:hypothetical protein
VRTEHACQGDLASNLLHLPFQKQDKLGVVVHICDPSTLETEAGRSQVWGQLELHSKTLYE